ncbi:formylglycine-generating enzyme family protein [Compostibacter hankyongensis]|uniref:Formylglycine-generating enzyme family protein n=1 Tax=Compostibacter hankyongensis TaxID=1007089 RepID=A0ABP8FN98_9BACT
MNRSAACCLLSALFILLSFRIRAQEKGAPAFKPYAQTIPNTEVSFRMIPVPAGSFLMGSPEGESGRNADEGPQTRVKVSAFWIGEHEVTYDEYIHFQDETRDTEPKPDGITRPSPPYVDFTLGMGKAGGYPANSMTQYAALMYCQWLYKKTGVFYRLPTEAEWEYACRAGSTGAYFFGGDSSALSTYAWYGANSDNKYHAVKQLKPNAWGLYDMLGNMAEWTLDQYQEKYFEKIKAHPDDPWMQPDSKHPRTLKGGHFRDGAAALRSAARLRSSLKWNARDPQIPKSKWWIADAPFVGFRVVRPLKQPSPEEVEKFFSQVLMQ